jgi:PhnB protein
MDRDADTDTEAQIKRLIHTWTEALRSRDVEALMAACTPDFVSFDLAPPLRHGAADYREGMQQWFASFASPIVCTVSQLEITSAGGIAFSRSLNRVSGRKTGGEEVDLWVRATICYRRIGGEWRVAHEHVSVPFYMDGSFRAAVDLHP